jgi:uncharacterized protein with PIN domain
MEYKMAIDSGIEGAELSPQGRCPFCRYQIHILEEKTAAVIKAAVIKTDLRARKTFAKCPKCKGWLVVPLQYRPDKVVGLRVSVLAPE